MKKLFNPRGGKVVTIYTDGSTTTEYAGAGAVVLDVTGTLIRLANRVLPVITSTEAEYAALLLGMELAQEVGAVSIEFRLDSEVVVNQMTGRYAVNSPRIKTLHWDACALARQFPHVVYTYIVRTENGLADALAAEASAGREWRLA